MPCLDSSLIYLNETLPMLLEQKRQDFEVIVSINPTDNNNYQSFSSLRDPRLRVIRPQSTLSMNEHYEFVLKHARGSWIQIIGADDFLAMHYFDSLDKILNQYPSVQVINWTRAYYFWNSNPVISPTQINYPIRFGVTKVHNRFRMMLSLLGITSFFDLPQIYTTSLISSQLIETLRQAGDGCVYHSIVPDVYSSLAIQSKSPMWIRSKKPLTWVGTSKSSFGFKNAINTDTSKRSICNQHNHNQIHENISHEVFLLNLGSIYLLEAYLNLKRNLKFQNRSWECYLIANLVSDSARLRFPASLRKQLYVLAKISPLIFLIGLGLSGLIVLCKIFARFFGGVFYYVEAKKNKRRIFPSKTNITPPEANKIMTQDFQH